MSGNPFRRPQQPAASSPTTPETRFPPVEDLHASDAAQDQPRRPSTTKPKRVRIETPPPLSPDPATPLAATPGYAFDAEQAIYQVGEEAHTGSPPPQPLDDGVEFNPFDRGFDELVKMHSPEVMANTRRNSGSGSVVPALPALPSPEGKGAVPANPFSRTLATIEAESASAASVRSEQDGNVGRKDGAMGVDDFAKMLLTGKGPAVAGEPQAVLAAARPALDGQEVSTDSDEYATSSEDDDDEDDAYETRRSDRTASTTKQKPPPPKHRHGKSVSAAPTSAERTPQTVSFEDFDNSSQSVPAATVPARQPSGKALPQPPPLARRTTQELGKPLPSSPATGISRPTTEPLDTTTPSRPSSLREPAPPPPKSTKPPPPPPTRRANARSSVYAAPDTPDMPPLTASPAADDTPSTAPQPNRALATALKQGPSSRSSSRSAQGRDRDRDRATPMAPPPPPRRRGSSKSSMDQQATAQAPRSSTESARQTSVSAGSEGDVLANLEALQAEVDALRERFRGAG